MTIRELINNGYHFQSAYKVKSDALKDAINWIDKNYLVEILWVSPSGKWEVWIK